MKSRCHIWWGTKTRRGYGRLETGGKTRYAHRILWNMAFGEIKPGHVLVNMCGQKACVNLEHWREMPIQHAAWKAGEYGAAVSAGAKHPFARFSRKQVVRLRRRSRAIVCSRKHASWVVRTAKQHNVKAETLRKMLRGESYGRYP